MARKYPLVKIGQRFGRLVVLSEAPKGRRGIQRFNVRCDCGTDKICQQQYLVTGRTKSCGCGLIVQRTHGLSSHPLYDTWRSMHRRCTDRKDRNWNSYGGRGIRVCRRWRDVAAFIGWAEANGWKPGHEIHRKDNDGNYQPTNCQCLPAPAHRRHHRPRLCTEINAVLGFGA